ncbi:MAG: FKBP-type peptidyl-prolyl cis-trans isomerase N-terminal domain-containing protein [Thermodesulfobacteriota bacterium]
MSRATRPRAPRSPALAALACVLATLACDAPPRPLPASEEERTSYAVGLHLGARLRAMEAEVDPGQVVAGFADGIDGEGARPVRLDPSQVTRELASLADGARASARDVARTAALGAAAFFASNRARPGVVELPSGVQYRIVAGGDQPPPALADRITVEYEGRLLDGAVFDTSQDRFAPTIIRLAKTPRAWREVLPLVPGGATVEVWVPGDLEPTQHPVGLVPAGEPLAFTLRVTAIDRHRNPDAARASP